MQLWQEWCACVQALRPACTRRATFAWMMVALAGFCLRTECAGVSSFLRALALHPRVYPRLLHVFHSSALRLDRLTQLWVGLCIDRLPLDRVQGALVCIADGLKVGKEGRKMPAVKWLRQSSSSNSRPEFLQGHSLQALSLLAGTPSGPVRAVPVAARIQEGVREQRRRRKNRPTLLDRLVELFREAFGTAQGSRVILVADSAYASGTVMRPLLQDGYHLVTRARSTAVAYRAPPRRRPPALGRPRKYGRKVVLRQLFHASDVFRRAQSPVYGERGVPIQYRSMTLLWRPVARPVQFVLVRHPQRGSIILMTTDLALDPLEVIRLYGYRFKIECDFRQALQVLGTYRYHFWMSSMPKRRRGDGENNLSAQSERYKAQVWRKIAAYHRFIQLGCIAQGLLQHLALRFGTDVWQRFRSWLRTMNPALPPSEAVVVHALRNSLPEFLAGAHRHEFLAQFVRKHQTLAFLGCCRCASG
jgi:hypothetical protein